MLKYRQPLSWPQLQCIGGSTLLTGDHAIAIIMVVSSVSRHPGEEWRWPKKWGEKLEDP